MKNLLNCHAVGVHSFPIRLDDNGYYKRVFYADKNHTLYNPVEIAIHPHHVDIKITVLDGVLFNPIYDINDTGDIFKKFIWRSHILNGNGGFEYLGEEKLIQSSNKCYGVGEQVTMKACELHTVQVQKDSICVWMIEESKPTCDYFPVNYSKSNLGVWNSKGLYIECSNAVKDAYLEKYYQKINQ